MFYFGRGMKQMFLIFNFVVFFKKKYTFDMVWEARLEKRKKKKNFL